MLTDGQNSDSGEVMTVISVSVNTESDFPSKNELKQRDSIEKTIERLGVGSFVGAGAGMGSMDVEYVVRDPESARATIESALKHEFPELTFTIDLVEIEGSPEDFEDDGSVSPMAIVIALLVIALVIFGIYKVIRFFI